MPTVARILGDRILQSNTLLEGDYAGLTADGLRASSFIEQSLRPATAYYFPLSYSFKGAAPGSLQLTVENPLSDNNVIFDDVGAWVGTANTNLWKDTGDLYGFKSGTSGIYAPINNKYVDIQTATDSASASNAFSITSGTAYTVSAYFRSTVENTYLTPDGFKLVQSVGGSEIARSEETVTIPAGLWQRWQRGFGTATYLASITAYPWITAPAGIRICAPMIEARPFVSAYTASSNTAGLLRFNLYNQTGLRWNQDYTIMYWKRMHGTHTNNLSGYNIDSIGRNSNTVGGGCRWWGKDANVDKWRAHWDTTGVSFTFASYQYKWLFVVLRRLSGILTLQVFSPENRNNPIYASSIDDSAATDNRYVTQNGYDLQLGGWDNQNPCNSYYRDLVVMPSAGLSDADILLHWNTMLSITAASEIYTGILQEGF